MDVTRRRWVFDKAKVSMVLFVSFIIFTNFEACHCQGARQGGVKGGGNSRFRSVDDMIGNYGTPSVRPDDGGDPVVVNLGIRLTRLHSVKEIDMEMDSTLILYVSWYDSKLMDSKLANRVTNIIGDSIGKIWKPDIYFANGKDVDYDLVPTEGRIIKIISEGLLTGIFYVVRIHLVSSCPMNLELFPFDTQQCSIVISSTGYTTDDLRFRWYNETEDGFTPVKMNLARLAQFRVSPNIMNDEYEMLSEIDQKNVSFVSTTVTLRRDPVYYFWSYYLPSSLIVLLSWVNFYIDVDAAPARISLGTTLVLTQITLIYSARSHLPKIAYPTAITVWLDAQGIFVVLALVEYALSHQLNYQHKLETMLARKKTNKKEEEKTEADLIAESQNMYYMSGYSKEIYDEYHMDTTYTAGSGIIGGFLGHIANLFKRDRAEDYAVKDDAKEPTKKQHLGAYRWWALEIDYVSRFLFPIVYFTGLAVYVCSYRVWEVFLEEVGYADTDN